MEIFQNIFTLRKVALPTVLSVLSVNLVVFFLFGRFQSFSAASDIGNSFMVSYLYPAVICFYFFLFMVAFFVSDKDEERILFSWSFPLIFFMIPAALSMGGLSVGLSENFVRNASLIWHMSSMVGTCAFLILLAIADQSFDE